MSKISLEQVEATLLEKKIEPQTVSSILKDLETAIQEEKEEREATKLPRVKSEHIVYLNGAGEDSEAWVVTYQEGTDAGTVLQKIRDAAKAQNEATSQKKSTLDNLGEVFQGLKTTFLKGTGIKIKTKESVRVVQVDGKRF